MSQFNQAEQHVQQAIKAGAAVAPALATVTADVLGIINTVSSIILLVLSAAFLLWRWRVAYREDREKHPDAD